MAFLIQNGVIINDQRELIGVSTAGINTALYVGSDIQLDGGAGIVTATSFVGSGAALTDIDANVIVSDGIPTGISTAEGDLYYDSSDLKLFTYYDDNWIEASPVPPGATTLSVTNEVGVSTAQVDLLTETLVLSGSTNQVSVGVNSNTDTLTIGLTNDVSIGGSMAASTYYGDGSNLENIIGSGGDGTISGSLTVDSLTAVSGPSNFTGDVNLNDNLVGDGSSNISGINSVIANTFYGDGSNLEGVGLDAADFYEAGGIQVGVLTVTGNSSIGDLSSDLVTINASVNSDLVPNGNQVQNLGSPTNRWDSIYAQSLDLTGSVTLTGGDLEAANVTATSSLEATRPSGIGLTVTASARINGNLSIGSSVTAATFFGDGSGLTGIGLNPDSDIVTTGDIQAGIITATERLVSDGTFEVTGIGTFNDDVVFKGSLAGRDITFEPASNRMLFADNAKATFGTNTDAQLFHNGGGAFYQNFTGNSTFQTPEGSKFRFNRVLELAEGQEVTGVSTFSGQVQANGAGIGLTVQNDAYINTLDVNTFTVGDGSGTDGATATFQSPIEANYDINIFADLVGPDDGSTGNITGVNSITAGGAITADKFYGDGSELTDIDASKVTSEDNQDLGEFPMPFLSDYGAGASIYTDSTANEEFTYSPSTGILKAKEFDALSDARLKTDIVNIEDALGKVAELRGVEYNWKNGSGSSVGVIAQELQEVYPQLVSDNGERLTVNYNGLVGLLIAAVNEMSAEIADLKAQK